jgi:hypothetical protein
MNFSKALFYTCLLVVLASCNLINPSEPIPTYVQIDSFQFKSSNPVLTGTARQKINSAFVYIDNQLIGAYELPARIPIISNKTGLLKVAPGVILNGLNGLQLAYPFFIPDTITLANKPGTIKKISPSSSYYSATLFKWQEDFEGGNTFTSVTGDTTLNRTLNLGEVYEGGASGKLYFKAPQQTAQVISTATFSLPITASYLELHYKNNIEFQVCIQVSYDQGGVYYEYISGFKPKNEWNKVYIDLQKFASNNRGVNYRIMIRADLPSGMSSGYVLFDNFKVVSY